MPTQSEIINANFTYLNGKIKDIELFKFPNAIIIGEPIIQNGQVSDFSTVSYLQFPFILDLHEKAFQIDFCFTTATNVQTQQNILDSKFGLALAIQNGKGVMAISSNGTSWDIGSVVGTQTLQSNTTYYARLIWDRLQYKTQLSTDGVNYVDDMVIVDTRRPFPTTIFIGGCDTAETGHAGHPFLGSINLNKCSLSVMNNVIWQGMDDAGLATRADVSLSNLDQAGQAKFDAKQDKLTAGSAIDINNDTVAVELFDRNKFQVVGSPTITDDGIASGFSLNNYMLSKNFDINISSTSIFEINAKFKTPSDNNTYYLFNLYTDGGTYQNSSEFVFRFDSTGAFTGFVTNLGTTVMPTTAFSNKGNLNPNTTYNLKFGYNGTQYYINIGDIIIGSYTVQNPPSGEYKLALGIRPYNQTSPFLGSIDIKQLSIIVDGVEVFSGANTIYHFLSNKQDVGDYALASDIPTNVSDLNNDSNFITRQDKATSDLYGTVKLEWDSETGTLNIVN